MWKVFQGFIFNIYWQYDTNVWQQEHCRRPRMEWWCTDPRQRSWTQWNIGFLYVSCKLISKAMLYCTLPPLPKLICKIWRLNWIVPLTSMKPKMRIPTLALIRFLLRLFFLSEGWRAIYGRYKILALLYSIASPMFRMVWVSRYL